MDRWDGYAGYDELYHADYYGMYDYYPEDELYHYGVKGQKWGVRRYQNADGSLTDAGRAHYGRSYGGRRAGGYSSRRGKKVNWRKVAAVGAGVAGAAALGYGAYRLAKSGKLGKAASVARSFATDPQYRKNALAVARYNTLGKASNATLGARIKLSNTATKLKGKAGSAANAAKSFATDPQYRKNALAVARYNTLGKASNATLGARMKLSGSAAKLKNKAGSAASSVKSFATDPQYRKNAMAVARYNTLGKASNATLGARIKLSNTANKVKNATSSAMNRSDLVRRYNRTMSNVYDAARNSNNRYIRNVANFQNKYSNQIVKGSKIAAGAGAAAAGTAYTYRRKRRSGSYYR